MKTIVVLAVSIVLLIALFCPMVMAAPSMPDDLQIVQPDPSLPKELSAFFGKWEGPFGAQVYYFLIVEKIDQEKVTFYLWREGPLAETVVPGWERIENNVIKERGKYKLWWRGPLGNYDLTLKGEYLEMFFPIRGGVRLRRVP